MNLPNKLTCLRMLMVPFFVAAMVLSFSNHYLWALILFVTASFTDMLDGKIARKRGLITDFGKFMDPLADKILVTSALICFVELWVTPAAVIIVIIAREFVVTSLRLIAAPKGIVIAADIFGKMKISLADDLDCDYHCANVSGRRAAHRYSAAGGDEHRFDVGDVGADGCERNQLSLEKPRCTQRHEIAKRANLPQSKGFGRGFYDSRKRQKMREKRADSSFLTNRKSVLF